MKFQIFGRIMGNVFEFNKQCFSWPNQVGSHYLKRWNALTKLAQWRTVICQVSISYYRKSALPFLWRKARHKSSFYVCISLNSPTSGNNSGIHFIRAGIPHKIGYKTASLLLYCPIYGERFILERKEVKTNRIKRLISHLISASLTATAK